MGEPKARKKGRGPKEEKKKERGEGGGFKEKKDQSQTESPLKGR